MLVATPMRSYEDHELSVISPDETSSARIVPCVRVVCVCVCVCVKHRYQIKESPGNSCLRSQGHGIATLRLFENTSSVPKNCFVRLQRCQTEGCKRRTQLSSNKPTHKYYVRNRVATCAYAVMPCTGTNIAKSYAQVSVRRSGVIHKRRHSSQIREARTRKSVTMK
jgi:hypothetical protein